jgi:hypothetical protein
MKQRRSRAERAVWRRATSFAACPALVLACAPAACNKTPDCFDIHPGNRIAITVVEVYETNPYTTQFPCPGFDLTPGLTLVATDLGNPEGHGEGDTCNAAAVRIDPFADWTWTPASTSTGSAPTILTGSFNATSGTCTGYVSITAKVMSNGQPFAASEAGQTPNVVMERTFTAQDDGGGGCPHTCIDDYSVKVARL